MASINPTAGTIRVEQAVVSPYRPARPIQRLILPIIVLTAALSVVFASSGNATVAWVTAFTFASFIFVVNGPAWALAPILINEMTLYSFLNPTFGLSQRTVVVGVAILFAITAISTGHLFDDVKMRRVLIPSIVFVTIVTVMNLQHSDEAYVFQYLRYQLVQLAMLILFAVALRQVRDVRQIALVVTIVAVTVSLIVMWQHYGPASALYGVREGTPKGRAVGLVNSPVSLANQLIFILPPIFGVLLSTRFSWSKRYFFLPMSAFLVAVALNYTYTRSAVFALAPTFVIMALMFGGRRRTIMVACVILGVIAFFALENTGLIGYRYYRTSEDDRSASSHEALQDVSLAIALDHPIEGIGHEAFTTIAPTYLDAVDEEVVLGGGLSAIGDHQPHNDFLNVWLSWGIFALIAFIGIYLGTLRNLIIAARHTDPFMRGLAIGCAGGVVAYGINSFYHNSLDSSAFLLMYAGISVALARMAIAARATSGNQTTL